MKTKKYYNILKVCILLLFLFLGVYLRVKVPYDTLTLNTVAFYFSRAEYLENNGEYLKEDSKTLALYNYKENYPPLPAYIAVPIFKIIKPFGMDFKKFLAYFPVLVYIVTFFVGFVLIKNLYNSDAGLFFSILLSITPVAVKSTIKTYYTEEALGILFIIASVYYLIKSKKIDSNFFFALLFLTLLSLTWQVFLLIDLVIGILFLFNFRNKKLMVIYSVLIICPLIIGHILSVYIIGLDYSPIKMIKESLITLRDGNKDYFRIAFSRVDLLTPGIKHVFNEFGWFISFLILVGFIYLLFNFKEEKNKVLAVSGLVASFAFFYSTKFRYFSMASLIIIGAIGAYSLLNFSLLKKYQKTAIGIITIVIALFFILNKISTPLCSKNLEVPEDMQLGKYYPLTFTVKNIGF